MSEENYYGSQLLDQLVEIAQKLQELEEEFVKSLVPQSEHQEYTEFFMSVLQKAKDGIVILGESEVILANPKICEMVGATLEEVIGSDLR